MNTMYDYYLEQPGVLNDIFSNRASAAKAFVESFGRERPDRLYLIASGSSLNAALAAEAFMELALGIEVRCSAPSSLPAIRGEWPFILFISQGGSSTNTIAAIKALSAYPMLALTGAEACRHQRLCAHSLIPCRTGAGRAQNQGLYRHRAHPDDDGPGGRTRRRNGV